MSVEILYQLRFLIEGLPSSTNSARKNHKHWVARHREDKGWKKAVWAKCIQMGRPFAPLTKASLTLVRHSSVRPDYEGLVSTFKPVIDGLTEAGVIENDSYDVVGNPEYLWEKAKPGSGYIEVIVHEVVDTQLQGEARAA